METKKNVYIKEVERYNFLMIKKTIAIAALARNCEENLPDNIERIEKLRKKFSDSAVFVYENNSTDSTRNILHKWSSTSNCVWVKSEDIDESPYKSGKKVGRLYRGTEEGRIRKMCDCRNKLLDMIRNKGPFDFVIFIDIDIAWFSIDGVVSAIQNAPEGWGGLFANCYVTFINGGISYDFPMHYDTFAILQLGNRIERIKYRDLNQIRRTFLSKKIYDQANCAMYFECLSAFGGVGIYKWEQIEDLKYEVYTPSSWEKTGSTLCEHIYFNSRVIGKKYIVRDLKVCYHYFETKGLRWMITKHFPLAFGLFSVIKSVIK